jgi:aryl-alcohol dehydrogenase-like predicted oxidoreductase
LIGSALPGAREDWVIATKVGHRYVGEHARTQEWSAREVLAQLDRSLRALRTDYVDLYQFHSGDDAAFDNDELWDALAARVAAGAIRHLGISLGSSTNTHQVQRAIEVGASVIQVVYSRLDTEPEADTLPRAQEADLGVLAREALAGGLLSGKYPPGSRFTDPTDTRSGRPVAQIEARLRAADQIKRSEVSHGVAMATWALAWCLANPTVTAVLPGCKTVAQLDANAAAADLDLSQHPDRR